MNIGIAGFEACICAPSPAPSLPAMPSFSVPTHLDITHQAQILPTSSIESLESSIYSHRPYSIDSAESRTSWSSAEVDWAQQGATIEDSHCTPKQENIELSKQVSTWQAKFETLQMAYSLLLAQVPASPQMEHRDCITNIAGKGKNENKDGDIEVEAEGEEP
ncbi:hypothetical protein CVT25_012945 [Psilocybe cyanescens]|uniref:Uncharacterized protein n=1 Tax=Psilocybe cyanescens TaxID=93625 RepID=A0A409XT23_PSICY|nr:hypothetical protein CVT25_012945 [Psilocybe cyanescens]